MAGLLVSAPVGSFLLPSFASEAFLIDHTDVSVILQLQFSQSVVYREEGPSCTLSKCEEHQNGALITIVTELRELDKTLIYEQTQFPSSDTALIFFATGLSDFPSAANRAEAVEREANLIVKNNSRLAHKISGLSAEGRGIDPPDPLIGWHLSVFFALLLSFTWIVVVIVVNFAYRLARTERPAKGPNSDHV